MASADADAGFPPRMESRRRTLRIGTSEVSGIYRSFLSWGLFEKTFRVEPGGRRLPVLVTSIPSLENGGARPRPGGGVVVTWRLRPGLRFSDGAPLTAEDIVFTLTTFRSRHLINARATDARTVVAEWDDAVADAYGPLIAWPSHVMEPVRRASGSDGVLERATSSPVPLMGPYKVVEFARGARLVVEANPHFPGPPPSIARIELVQAPVERLIPMFEAGELDLIDPHNVTTEQAEALAARRPEAVNIRPSTLAYFLQLDLSNPVLARREVRVALVQTIDRERLAAEVIGRGATLCHAPAPEASLGEGTHRYGHDAEAARAALDLAGASGARLPLVTAGAQSPVLVEGLARDLEAAGLTIERREVDPAGFRPLYRDGRHGGLMLVGLHVSRDSRVLAYWGVPIVDGVYDRTYRSAAYDDSVATLVERLERTASPARREQLFADLDRAYAERLPMIPLFFRREAVIADPALRGWEDTPVDASFSENIDQWYFAR
jgi:peptide/nickel transport system substrate-binding protein